MGFVVTADSSPVYDTFGFADYWGCAEWIQWWNALNKKYGKDGADYVWGAAWLDGLSNSAGGNGTAPGSSWIIDSVPLDCRTLDGNFKTFIDGNENIYNVVYSGIGGLIAKPLGLGVSIINGAVKIGSDVVDTATTTSKILKYAIPIAVVVAILLMAYIAYETIQEHHGRKKQTQEN